MAVKIRLRRTGARNQPRYRVVVADSRFPRDGRFIEVIGYYNPTRQPHEFEINAELALKWLGRGAQPTETVGDLLMQRGIMSKFYESQGKPVPPEMAARHEPAPTTPEAAAPAPQAAATAPEPAAEPPADAGAAATGESAGAAEPETDQTQA
jgi:small subunit ribosomal protein S16